MVKMMNRIRIIISLIFGRLSCGGGLCGGGLDNDNFVPYCNCFRGCTVVSLFILIDVFHDNETVKFLCIFAIIIIVFSFTCSGTSRIPRINRISGIRRIGRRNLRRNRHVHNENIHTFTSFVLKIS